MEKNLQNQQFVKKKGRKEREKLRKIPIFWIDVMSSVWLLIQPQGGAALFSPWRPAGSGTAIRTSLRDTSSYTLPPRAVWSIIKPRLSSCKYFFFLAGAATTWLLKVLNGLAWLCECACHQMPPLRDVRFWIRSLRTD